MSPQLRLYARRAFRVLAIIAWFYVATGDHNAPGWMRIVGWVSWLWLLWWAAVEGIDRPMWTNN